LKHTPKPPFTGGTEQIKEALFQDWSRQQEYFVEEYLIEEEPV
jgi:hypothetical protein